MLHAAEQATPGLYPDATDGRTACALPLEYHLEPGHPADGVTATVPLAALNQLPAEPFEWLVPGMLKEKLVALIKTMPKELRVKFVPGAGRRRRGRADTLEPADGLAARRACADQLGKQIGVQVGRGRRSRRTSCPITCG